MKIRHSVRVLAAAIALAVSSMPILATEMDDKIESSAKASHVFKTYLTDDKVMIESENGAVTLTGTVADRSHKLLALDTVSNLPGVVSVDNQIEISPSGPSESSDAWLMTKIKATLLFHSDVSTLTEVSAKNGVVTLRGNADNQAEKELTAEYTKDIEGVLEVKNEMTVADTAKQSESNNNAATMTSKIDDASITAMAKMILLSHRSTSALHTSVKTTDGVVTLSGEAKNEAEIKLATKVVSDSRGVIEVNNMMTVAKN